MREMKTQHFFQEENHPLLNPLVAYEIIQHLPRKEILKCRLVCGSWDTEACRLLRKTFTLDFHDLLQVHKFHALLEESEQIKGDLRDLPFAKIQLRASFRLGHTLAQEFFKNHGHIIRHLQILKVGCDCGANFFQKLLFYQAKNLSSLNLQIISAPIRLSPESGFSVNLRSLECTSLFGSNGIGGSTLELPNLRKLHLRHQLFVERSSFVKELLIAATNLEVLTTDQASPEFCSGIIIPTVLNCPNSWSKLKRLLCGREITLTQSQIHEFCSRRICLEELRIHFNHKSPNSIEELIVTGDILALLKHLRHSLRRVELNNRQEDVSFELDEFPRMVKLEELKLVNVIMDPGWLERLPELRDFEFIEEQSTGLCIPLGNLQALPNFPTLRRLTLSPMCILNMSDMNDMGLWWDVNGAQYIRKIAQAFPKLKGLSLNGNDAILKGIYEEFPLLEELKIHGPVTDEGVTGISLNLCEIMHTDQDYRIANLDQLGEAKFIGDLEKLRKLVIVPSSSTNLTEVSVFFGLICCKDLIHLELHNPELVKLWKEELCRFRETNEPNS